ncbi:hypothetical protein J4421_01920 [Candidatus Woesearchaeota archaeon]|nr:hypothetical protein [Candidatus Woesearchaeota archaeon]
MTSPPPIHPHHSLRFYIIMSTIVIAGIFFLLVMNNKGDFSLTSAIVKTIGQNNETAKSVSGEEDLPGKDFADFPLEENELTLREEEERTSRNSNEDSSSPQGSKSKTTRTKTLPRHEMDITLTSDQIPDFQEEAHFSDLTLRFTDLITTIRINKDRLELNDQESTTKTIHIKEGIGKINFDKEGIFLDLTVSRFELNDVAIAAKGEIKITFEGPQDYTHLLINNLKAESFDTMGSGELQVDQRLTYKLVDDLTTVDYFAGSVTIDRETDLLKPITTFQGRARGIGISGDLLDIDLR